MGDAPRARWRRIVRPVLVGAIVAAGLVGDVATPVPAGATGTFTFNRLAGNDRYETASAVAKAFAAGTTNAVVATGESFPDSLAGNYLAGALAAPIVLTARNALPGTSATTLADLKVVNVTVLGGPGAVSAAVENDLKTKGYNVDRIAGTDRYDTARLLAERQGAAGVGAVGGTKTAIVASGESFPDAVAAAPLSFASRLPTLLTTTDHLAPAAKDALTMLGIKQVLLLGGSAAISPTVESDLTRAGMSVVRIAGTNRSETATKLADYAIANLGFTNSRVTLARGDAFADALAGGPNGGAHKAPTLLAESPFTLGTATTGWLQANAGTLATGDILGGVSAITSQTEAAAESAAGNRGDAPVLAITSGPADGALTNVDAPTYKGTATDDVDVVKIEAKLDGGSFGTIGVTCSGCGTSNASWQYTPATGLASGTHTISFRAIDGSGTSSPEVTRALRIDTIKPTLDAVAANAGNSTITAIFSELIDCQTVSKDDFTVKLKGATKTVTQAVCDGTSDSTIGLVIDTAAQEGDAVAVTLQGEVNDVAGNAASYPQPMNGTTAAGPPPKITLTGGPADGALINSNRPTYSGTASDDGTIAKVEVVVDRSLGGRWSTDGVSCNPACDGKAAPVNWTYQPAGLGDGHHDIEFRATDGSGHVSTELPHQSLTVDTKAPGFTGVTATKQTSTARALFDEPLDCATVEQDGRDFTVTVDDGATRAISAASCSGSTVALTFVRLIPGGATVTVAVKNDAVVTDPAGNKTQQGASNHTDPLPNSTPTSTITGPSGLTNDATPEYSGTAVDEDGPPPTVKVDDGGAGFTPVTCTETDAHACAWSFTSPTLNESTQPHTFTFQVTDQYGAKSEYTRSVTVDTTPPQFLAVGGSPDGSIVHARFSEPLECSTVQPSDFHATVDGGTTVKAASCTGSIDDVIDITLDPAPAAERSVTLELVSDVMDPAGNRAQQTGLMVDRKRPNFKAVNATASDPVVTVIFDEPILCTTVQTSDFEASFGLLQGGAPIPITAEGCDEATHTGMTTFTLTLQSPPAVATQLRVTLVGEVTDLAGNAAPTNVTQAPNAG